MGSDRVPDHEVIIVGAGVAGIYQLVKLLELGIKATVLDSAPDLGGTWYWNRYPGARFDSESYTYGYSFSKEVLNEWHWKERFSSQPENLRYLNFVADKYELRPHMQFNMRVRTAEFNEAETLWCLRTECGRTFTARFVILAIGLLSTPTKPRLPGVADFRGQSFHTYNWPHEPVALEGRRVAVVGTGATGIQVISAIAGRVGQLTVFQRRPNWSAPLNNGPISALEMESIRQRYDEIFATCARTPGGFSHEPDRRGFFEVSKEDRIKLWDRLYDEPGFGIWLANFREIFTDDTANAEFSEYIADRIRKRVHDPAIAEKLIPKDHGFGVQRVPLETNYFEVYNQNNVELVDVSATPIERITESGIRTTEKEYAFDVIVYATGFDAITGAFDQIDIRGAGGVSLRTKWQETPYTYLGLLVNGFPNLLMPGGPQSGSASTNYPRAIETGVNWCTDLIRFAVSKNASRMEPSAEAEKEWTEEVVDRYAGMLMRRAKSWFTGYNSNVPGHEEGRIRYFVYNGGAPRWARYLKQEADGGFRSIKMDGPHLAANASS